MHSDSVILHRFNVKWAVNRVHHSKGPSNTPSRGTKHPAVPVMQQTMPFHFLLSSTNQTVSSYLRISRINHDKLETSLSSPRMKLFESCLKAVGYLYAVSFHSGSKYYGTAHMIFGRQVRPPSFNHQPSIYAWFGLWSKLAPANPIKSTHWDRSRWFDRWCSWCLSMKQLLATHDPKNAWNIKFEKFWLFLLFSKWLFLMFQNSSRAPVTSRICSAALKQRCADDGSDSPR